VKNGYVRIYVDPLDCSLFGFVKVDYSVRFDKVECIISCNLKGVVMGVNLIILPKGQGLLFFTRMACCVMYITTEQMPQR